MQGFSATAPPPTVVVPPCSPDTPLHPLTLPYTPLDPLTPPYTPVHPLRPSHTRRQPHIHTPAHTRTPLHPSPPPTPPYTGPATVLLNPPREGVVEPQVLEAARQAESVLYLSCNPHTLARDLAALGTTHRVSDAALFDQFPHTPHAEVGVMLQRRRLATRPRLTRGTETDGDGGRWQGTL